MSRSIQVGWDEDGEPLKWPARYVVCWRCRGEATHVNPSIDGNGITASEMIELGDEFCDDYLAGVYDVVCQECNGDRVVLEVDEEALTEEEIAVLEQARHDEWESKAVDRSEARYFGYDR